MSSSSSCASSTTTNLDSSRRGEAKASRVSSNSFLKAAPTNNGGVQTTSFSSMLECKENSSLAGNTSKMTVEEFFNDKNQRSFVRGSNDCGGYQSNSNNAKL